MAEEDEIFKSKVKYSEIFNFSDFYKYCFDWLEDDGGFEGNLVEDKYVEKLKGDSKEIDVEWTGKKKFTDYFRFKIKVTFKILNLKKIEITHHDKKISTNKGTVEISVKGLLVKDYDSKFEQTAFKKFLRAVYEKWVIPSRVEYFEEKISNTCNDFLGQAKAYLDIEGKK